MREPCRPAVHHTVADRGPSWRNGSVRGVAPRQDVSELARRAARVSSPTDIDRLLRRKDHGEVHSVSTPMSSICASRRPTDVRVLDDDHGCYLGRSDSTIVCSGARRSTLVLGPTRAGKTSALLIPNVLLAHRAVVTT